MKQVQLVEITSFIEFAPQYFQHVSEAIINKVYGCILYYIHDCPNYSPGDICRK